MMCESKIRMDNDLNQLPIVHKSLNEKCSHFGRLELDIYNRQEITRIINSLPIEKASSYESYCLSPSYYEFTGRKGMWMYSSESSCIILCCHPNEYQEQLLIFPEISSNNDFDLTIEILHKLYELNIHAKLCRFTSLQKETLLDRISNSDLYDKVILEEIEEKKLDWIYPVHVLDVKEVCTQKGGKFEQLRQRLRKIEKDRLKSYLLQPEVHYDKIRRLVDNWAEKFPFDDYSRNDLVSPAEKLLTMYQEAPERFIGQVLYVDDDLKSYCICEKPVRPELPANELAITCFNDIKGLSEWQKVSLCHEAFTLGIEKINTGGSETIGLDRFKRKIGPSKSIALYSLQTNYRVQNELVI